MWGKQKQCHYNDVMLQSVTVLLHCVTVVTNRDCCYNVWLCCYKLMCDCVVTMCDCVVTKCGVVSMYPRTLIIAHAFKHQFPLPRVFRLPWHSLTFTVVKNITTHLAPCTSWWQQRKLEKKSQHEVPKLASQVTALEDFCALVWNGGVHRPGHCTGLELTVCDPTTCSFPATIISDLTNPRQYLKETMTSIRWIYDEQEYNSSFNLSYNQMFVS